MPMDIAPTWTKLCMFIILLLHVIALMLQKDECNYLEVNFCSSRSPYLLVVKHKFLLNTKSSSQCYKQFITFCRIELVFFTNLIAYINCCTPNIHENFIGIVIKNTIHLFLLFSRV